MKIISQENPETFSRFQGTNPFQCDSLLECCVAEWIWLTPKHTLQSGQELIPIACGRGKKCYVKGVSLTPSSPMYLKYFSNIINVLGWFLF